MTTPKTINGFLPCCPSCGEKEYFIGDTDGDSLTYYLAKTGENQLAYYCCTCCKCFVCTVVSIVTTVPEEYRRFHSR